MKNLLMIIAIMIGLVSCGNGEKAADEKFMEKDRVEVMYFHGKQRCLTCRAIEKGTNEVLNTMFANEMKDSTLVFKTVDISTPEGEKIADKYEVTWSSLFVNKWKDGEETRNNMTEFGFGNARKNPDAFKKELADKIRESLK